MMSLPQSQLQLDNNSSCPPSDTWITWPSGSTTRISCHGAFQKKTMTGEPTLVYTEGVEDDKAFAIDEEIWD